MRASKYKIIFECGEQTKAVVVSASCPGNAIAIAYGQVDRAVWSFAGWYLA
jgi:hypothetical protein